MPHLDVAFPQLLRLCGYFHEMVRSQAYGALAACCACSAGALGAAHPSVQAAVSAALGALSEAAEDDDDKEAVAAAMEGAAEVLRALGPGVRPEPFATKLGESVLAVLQRKATCQRVRFCLLVFVRKRGGAADPRGRRPTRSARRATGARRRRTRTTGSPGRRCSWRADIRSPPPHARRRRLSPACPKPTKQSQPSPFLPTQRALQAAVAELLPQLAAGAGPGCLQAYSDHFQALLKRAKPTAPSGERAGVCAAFAEVVKEVRGAAAPAAQLVLPLCVREMGAEATDCQRNAAFCAGQDRKSVV